MNNKIIEALLYVKGKEGLSSKELSFAINDSKVIARKEIKSFMKKWNNEEHGIKIIEFNDVFKFATIESLQHIISNLVTDIKKQKLSTAAIEIAGIIAYKQPITKSQINLIRGVSSEAVVNTLLLKGLIEEAGIEKTPGNPVLYKISNKFYDYFNISSIKELPKLSEFNESEKEEFELFSSQRN